MSDLQKVTRPLPDKLQLQPVNSMASCSLELVSFNARGLGNEKKREKSIQYS